MGHPGRQVELSAGYQAHYLLMHVLLRAPAG